MPWIRYLLYFITIAFITWALTQMEIASPGSLKLHVLLSESDHYGTSEFSPVEIIQAIILAVCGVIMAWVARSVPAQQPIRGPAPPNQGVAGVIFPTYRFSEPAFMTSPSFFCGRRCESTLESQLDYLGVADRLLPFLFNEVFDPKKENTCSDGYRSRHWSWPQRW